MKDLSNDIVIQKENNGISYLQFRELLKYENRIKHCYTIRNDDLDFSLNREKEKTKDSFEKIKEALNIKTNNIFRVHQTHSANSYKVTNESTKSSFLNNDDLLETDALITSEKNMLLSTNSADCTSILVYDKNKKVVSNIHSGWKGTIKKIAPKTIKKMILEYDLKVEELLVFLGPTIQKCCFEIEKDVKDIFENEFNFANEDIEKINDTKYKINAPEILKKSLLEIGIKKENIFDSGICTKCNNDILFSFRGGDLKCGRAAMITELI